MSPITDTVFPVTDEGLTRPNLRSWMGGAANLADYVQTGFAVTDAGAGAGTLGTGTAIASGTYISRDVTTALAFTDGATNHVFVGVDESAPAGAVVVTVNTPGTPPSTPYIKVATVARAGSVLTITDVRPLAMFASDVPLKNTKWLKGLNAAGTALRNLIRLNGTDDVEIGEATQALKLLGSALTFGGTSVVLATRQVLAGTGLTGGGDLSADRTLTVAYGTSATTACVGNDARLSDQRTPTDLSVTDAKVAAGAAIAESKLSLASDAAAGTASRRTLGTGATQAAAGNHNHDGRYPRLFVGTWTGDGAASIAISLSSRPRRVTFGSRADDVAGWVIDPNGDDNETGHIDEPGIPFRAAGSDITNHIDLTATGFTAKGTGSGGLNKNGIVYNYVAETW